MESTNIRFGWARSTFDDGKTALVLRDILETARLHTTLRQSLAKAPEQARLSVRPYFWASYQDLPVDNAKR